MLSEGAGQFYKAVQQVDETAEDRTRMGFKTYMIWH